MASHPFIAPRLDPVVIAIDGPAASGKGTLARAIAKEYSFHYLDTGALYRAVAWTMLEAGLDPQSVKEAEKAAQTLEIETIKDEDLRTNAVSNAASIVAAMPGVRSAVLDFQRRFARQLPGSVIDGRDIGTIVCPDADTKLYVTASAKTRANRRFLELQAKGGKDSEEAILADVIARDERDANRTHSPLKPAEDAHLIDTSDLSIEAAFRAALAVIKTSLSPEAGAP